MVFLCLCLPEYFGDVFVFSSQTVMLLSFFNGDEGELCDEIGTACEFEGELIPRVVTCLFGMMGDDSF